MPPGKQEAANGYRPRVARRKESSTLSEEIGHVLYHVAWADHSYFGGRIVLDLLVEVTRVNEEAALQQRVAEEQVPTRADSNLPAMLACSFDGSHDLVRRGWAGYLRGVDVGDTSVEEPSTQLFVGFRRRRKGMGYGVHDDNEWAQ